MYNKKIMFAISFLICIHIHVHAQSGITSSGFSSDCVSYSIGLPFYTANTAEGITVSEGLIQIFVLREKTDINNSTVKIEAKVYPNPATSYLTLSLSKEGSYKVLLYDNAGILLNEFNVNGIEYNIPMQSYSAGIYYLNVVSENKNIKTFKIVKK